MAGTTTRSETVATTRAAGGKRKATRGAPPPGSGAVYGLGVIGALAYFLGTATTGRDYVLAVGKAMIWPTLLVYRAFRALGG